MAPRRRRKPVVLTIAGSDSGGGAGIQADLKTMCARNVYGASVVTALTAQNTLGVQQVHVPSAEFVATQLDSVLSDIPCDAVKIGMLPSADIVRVVADALKKYNVDRVVLDPVLVSTSGDSLVTATECIDALKNFLCPLTSILTPNIPEATAFTGKTVNDVDDMRRACAELMSHGSQSVLLKGGHRMESSDDPKSEVVYATDIFYDGAQFEAITKPWVNTQNSHGTGCTLASAIASEMAKGNTVLDSVRIAKDYVHEALMHSQKIGKGNGPLDHMYWMDR